jgi:hypothetical protein
MKTERLVILVSPEEKARLRELARHAGVSVAELVRSELPLSSRSRGGMGETKGRYTAQDEALTEGESAVLARLSEMLMERTKRANAALDSALDEIEANRAYFAEKAAR